MGDYVRYIEKTREYYLSEGYERPYEWAHFDEIPFTRLRKPLSQCRIGLVTTSDIAVIEADGSKRTMEPAAGNVYSFEGDIPPERFYSRSEHYDTHATHLDDVNSYFPVSRLRELVGEGRIGSLAARFQGLYTQYSQRRTSMVDAPEVLRQCREDGVDAVLLTPI